MTEAAELSGDFKVVALLDALLSSGVDIFGVPIIGENYSMFIKAYEDFMTRADLESKLRKLELAQSVSDVGIFEQ